MNLKKDEFLANRELEYRANRRMQEQAEASAQASAQAEQAVKAEAKKAYDSAVLRASHSIPVSNAADAGDRLRAQNTAPIPKSGEPQIQELPEQLGVAPPRSRGRPKGIPNPKGGRPKGSLNKGKKNDNDDISGLGKLGKDGHGQLKEIKQTIQHLHNILSKTK